MRKVCFLIPASPNVAFFSQIAAFRLAVSRLSWSRWVPNIRVFFGGEIDLAGFVAWREALGDIDMVFLSNERFKRDSFFAQGDARFYMAPDDADVVVMSDADTLPVGSIEDVLDTVFQKGAVAGTIAHLPFPKPEGQSSRDAWLSAAEGLIHRPLAFDHEYTLLKFRSPEAQESERVCPFYLNFGVVFIADRTLRSVSEPYLKIRRILMNKITNRFFSAQIAFTLALTELDIPTLSLSMAYNYPNDPDADAGYPEALSDVRIFHYLRKADFDRWKIFASPEAYAEFLSADMSGSNAIFRDFVRSGFGEAYPFRLTSEAAS